MRDAALRMLSACSFVLLAPVLFLQGRWVRRVTPRLPQAGGPEQRTVGDGSHPLRLLLVGESPAMGVGVSDHSAGLVGRTAHTLGSVTRRPITWRLLGRSGASARNLLDEFVEPAAPLEADVIVIALGVNDTISLSSVGHWTRSLDALLESLRRHAQAAPVVLTAVPPMQYFPALPSPLRQVLGLRAHVLDRAAIKWARKRRGVVHLPHPRGSYAEVREAFCSDGFHPSEIGYESWGAAIASAAAAALAPVAGR